MTVISDSRSAFYPKPPESPVVFYRIGKLADGTLTRTPVIEVDLSPGGQMPLLLFTRISESPEKLKVQVLNDDLQTFPGGSFRILNYEPSECGALIANKPTVIPAGGDKIIEPKPEEGQKAVFFQLYRLGKDDRKLVYSNNWGFSPGVRTLVVVTPAVPPSKQSMVRRITEPVSTITESP